MSTTFHGGYVVATQSDRVVNILLKAIDVLEAAGSVLQLNNPSIILLIQRAHSLAA